MLCSWPATLRHVHYPSQYSYLFPFPQPPPLRRWYSALLFPPTQLWLRHFSPSKRSSTLLIFWLLTPLRLNSCSLDSKTNLPKYTTLHLAPPTLLETLASSLTNILLALTKLQLSPKPVTITFVNFAVSGITSIRQLPVPSLPLSFTPNLITVILSTINSLSFNYSIIPSPAGPAFL